ncbi:putative tRNA 2'-phosphotransferase [Rhizophagus irregularis DAOM 181602=DAOM 197198]|uniref:2'-phosphotransferase n=1 Tax=Rhizophagus irregularis (strain DAOM 181602 / DAOM 197198 / MUCL 43194) TaxID=747089 RepID=A0A2P4Q1N9_RHIID|nr:putative tRNA 2'-phosphotransferase [Rhizophagus irregularis DAOM 181602=DAOM 197198]POG71575.1 putative tRNA 2'-phosphotransferase [Rhizophagus irregularis DAOM 181602=DAOM 197198]|eukprot:XP_025178441.1 putative tRNA 2'-phosphotransferase [Rhizophagus irregularis DAOM 181602=DAOM 197198]
MLNNILHFYYTRIRVINGFLNGCTRMTLFTFFLGFLGISSYARSETEYNYNHSYDKSTHYARNDNPIVKLSRSLSNVLRHNAIKEGLKIRPDGYVKVDDLMRLPRFRGTTFEKIQQVVNENDKQRFHLFERKSEGVSTWWIRANQGHSMVGVKDLELIQITNPSEFPQVIHGTNLESWRKIESHGLSRMNRNHIHFAVGRYGDANVTSGMRASCDVFIYVNVPKAMADNVKFSRSANGVILTEGIKGILEKKYFLKVIDKYNNVLYEDNDDKNVKGNNVNNKNVEGNNVNNKNVDGNNADGNNVNNKNVGGNNDDIKSTDGNKNVDGNNINSDANNKNVNENNNRKSDNDNKVTNNAWNGNNSKAMNSGGTNVNKGNTTAWGNNNDKIKNLGGTNDNRNKIVENNNKNIDINSVNVNRNNSNDNKRKNDNKDVVEGKRVFSYADIAKRQ